ncbi:phosphoenolpyruvate carboxykinase (ATP), partial [Staphylococcus arlettae]
AEFKKDDTFGLSIPVEVDDVPQTILNPINAWSDAAAYKEQAQDLINRFNENFEKFGTEAQELAIKGGFKQL